MPNEKPECNCASIYEDEEGKKIHYVDCALIQFELGY